MAKSSGNGKWIALGLLAIGGLWWWNNRQAAAAAAPAPGPAPSPTPLPLPTSIAPTTVVAMPMNTATQPPLAQPAPPASSVVAPVVSPVQANPVMVTAPGPIGPGETTDAGVPYDPRMATLQSWAVSSMTPCDLARWNEDQTNFTAEEWNGLYDLYFNAWIGGQGTTAARTAFWNAWRIKYSILTNTPC
jgi:hypothetical protein